MNLTGKWSGVMWGTNNGAVVIDLVQENDVLVGVATITEGNGIQYVASLKGAVRGGDVFCAISDVRGTPGVEMPKGGKLTARLDPEQGHIRGTWETDAGTAGEVVLFKFLQAQMPPPFAVSSKTVQFGPCRLDQEEIQALCDVISKGVSVAPPGINVMWDGRSSVRTGLKEVVQDGTIPSVAQDVILAVTDPTTGKGITVTFKKSEPNILFLGGDDSTWVEGRTAEILAFLGRHESRPWRFLKSYGANLNSAIFLFMLAVLPSVPSVRERATVLAATFVLLLLLNQFWTVTPYAKLFLRRTKPSWYERNSGTLWISILTGLLTVIIAYLLNRYWN